MHLHLQRRLQSARELKQLRLVVHVRNGHDQLAERRDVLVDRPAPLHQAVQTSARHLRRGDGLESLAQSRDEVDPRRPFSCVCIAIMAACICSTDMAMKRR